MENMCAAIGRAHEFFLCLKKAGFTDELIKEIINSSENRQATLMFEAICGQGSIFNQISETSFAVDYYKKFDDLIWEARCEEVNIRITQNIPRLPKNIINSKRGIVVKPFFYSSLKQKYKTLYEEDVVRGMNINGYRPATLFEQLAIGKKFLCFNRKFELIALDSEWKSAGGRHLVASMKVTDGKRCLDLKQTCFGFEDNSVFLGVRQDAGHEKFSNFIDLDAAPFIPHNLKLVEHKKGGIWSWDQEGLCFYHEEQNRRQVTGNGLHPYINNLSVLNANALNFILHRSWLVPEKWKNKVICFWGTIYNGGKGHCVRFLSWDGFKWVEGLFWLDDVLGPNHAAALKQIL